MPDLELEGRPMHYLDEGGGEPVICFVHGFPFASEMWRPQIDHLVARGRRCIAPDLFGFGRSDVPAEKDEYSIPGYADQVAGLLESLDAGPVVLAGLSMGGYIALDLIHRRPELVRALVLADTRAEADTDEARQRRADQQVFLAGGGERSSLAEGLLDALIGKHGPERERAIRLVRAFMLATPVEGWIGALEAMRIRADATPWLRDITVPTLVLVGADDNLTPVAAATDLAEGIPGAELVVLPDVGHVSNLEGPQEFTMALDRFLDRLRA
ncbi:MAG: alpha/beta hydrolase, partial [Actinomycetota bacterium]|nr:alpha/beta hydrolase [Actinomycetota bacterium]